MDTLPEQVQNEMGIESATWIIRKTRTGKATLFTLTSMDENALYQKALGAWAKGLIDEFEYEYKCQEGNKTKTTSLRIRRVWWKRWALALLESLLNRLRQYQ